MRSLILLAAFAAAAASAQGGDRLADRPVSRAEVVAAVERQFATMDLNHDGVVDAREFEGYYVYLARTPPTASVAFTELDRDWFDRANADANGTQRITLSAAMRRPLKRFGLADKDGDGVVSVRERNMAAMQMTLGE